MKILKNPISFTLPISATSHKSDCLCEWYRYFYMKQSEINFNKEIWKDIPNYEGFYQAASVKNGTWIALIFCLPLSHAKFR